MTSLKLELSAVGLLFFLGTVAEVTSLTRSFLYMRYLDHFTKLLVIQYVHFVF